MVWNNAPVIAAVAAVLSACTVYQYPRQQTGPAVAPDPAYATYYGPPGLHGSQAAGDHERHPSYAPQSHPSYAPRADRQCSCPCDCSEPGARASTPATRRAIPENPADWLEPEDSDSAARTRAPDDIADWLEPRESSPPRQPRDVLAPPAPPTPPLQRIPDDPADWLE